MDERRPTSAAVAALAVVVVGVAAATLGETTTSGATGVGGGSSGGAGTGGGGVPAPLPATGDPLPLIALLVVVTAVLLVIGFILFPRYALRQAGWAAVVTAFLIGILWLLFRAFGPARLGRPAEGPRNVSEPAGVATGGGQGMGEGGASLPEPVVLGLLVAGLLGLGVVGLLLRDGPAPGDADGDAGAGPTLAAIGRSAGRAADRIAKADDVTLDNEVYRAWKEMTDHLDVEEPAVLTPGEFREAALEAGMAAGDVDALTELFEEVRYGGAPATGEREREASAALRRIEERYTAEGEA